MKIQINKKRAVQLFLNHLTGFAIGCFAMLIYMTYKYGLIW